VKLDVVPTGSATNKDKRKWLVYELIRYKAGLSRLVTLKTIIAILYGAFILTVMHPLWLSILFLVFGVFVVDFAFHLLHAELYAGFYADLTWSCFNPESGMGLEHDFRILMNRVDNYLSVPADRREALYKDLEFCYTQLKIKGELREAHNAADKRNVQEEGKDKKA